mgnify:CR=1 FL=1
MRGFIFFIYDDDTVNMNIYYCITLCLSLDRRLRSIDILCMLYAV